MEHIDVTKLLVALITLITAVITVAPYFIAGKDEKKLNTLQTWIKVGVQAAEMMLGVGTSAGEKKLDYVMGFLAEKGLTADRETIRNIIESSVYEIKYKSTSQTSGELASTEIVTAAAAEKATTE